MNKVIIYTTNYCPYCFRAKELFSQKGVAYEEIDLTNDRSLRDEMSEQYHWQTVPMIFIGDEFIGGAAELFMLEKAGRLSPKLNG